MNQPMRHRVRDFFVYDLDFSALAANATATQTFQIESNSDFICDSIQYVADLAGAPVTSSGIIIPLVTILMQDSASNRSLSNRPVSLNAMASYKAGDPAKLPEPRRFKANGVVSVTLSNYSAATPYNIRLAFVGIKEWNA